MAIIQQFLETLLMNITGRFKEIHTILFANSIISAISSGVEKAGFQQLHFSLKLLVSLVQNVMNLVRQYKPYPYVQYQKRL